MRASLVALLAAFRSDPRGGTATLFGLAAVPAMMAIGASVEISSAYRTKAELQNATDAAALAAARVYRDSQSAEAAQGVAASTFAAAKPRDVSAILQPIVIDAAAGTIDARASARVQTQFAGLISTSYDSLPISSTARSIAGATAQGRDLEVSLMLDITISMNQNSGSPNLTKLQAMKQAALNFVSTVIQDQQTPHRSRAALVPFSSAVNVLTKFNAVTNTSPTGAWTSVVERSGPSAFTDDPPGAGAYFPSYRNKHGSALSPNSMIAKLERNRSSNIPVNAGVLPLTPNKTTLTNAINALAADGTTAGHIGTAWSWYTLSPRWASVWTGAAPAAYDTTRTEKVAILMSDFDYNVYYQSANGDMNAQARALCANMKAAGVTVYTIGFQVDPNLPDAVELFHNCASDPTKAIAAQTGAELIAAYQTLAQMVRATVASPVRLAR